MMYLLPGLSSCSLSMKSTFSNLVLYSFQQTSSGDVDDSTCNMEKDDSSSDSDVSDISGLSDLSNHDWEPSSGSMSWVQQQMMLGVNPRSILSEIVPNDAQIPSHLDDVTLWKV